MVVNGTFIAFVMKSGVDGTNLAEIEITRNLDEVTHANSSFN
jgi:hypothetical protein